MSKIFKKWWLVFALFLFIPLALLGGGEKSSADTSSEINYVKHTVMVKGDGKVSVSLIMSTEFPNNYTILQKEAFKTELTALLTKDLIEKKGEIISAYLLDPKEGYNPDEVIVFGDNGKAVQANDYVGYNIEYASLSVYKFYNNYVASYKKGFLYDTFSQSFDNIFNNTVQVSGSDITEAEKYKQLFISASEVVGMEDYATVKYQPYYYNDYMTLLARTKSTAYSIVKDSDNYYHHIWISESQNLTNDDEMITSFKIIHKGWWYLLGTFIPLAVMGVIILILTIIKRNGVYVPAIKK